MAASYDHLHDATLLRVEFIWELGMIEVYLRTASDPTFLLRVIDVTEIQATRNFEWGISAQVNAVVVSAKSVILEMQSGDSVRIVGTLNSGAELG